MHGMFLKIYSSVELQCLYIKIWDYLGIVSEIAQMSKFVQFLYLLIAFRDNRILYQASVTMHT